MFVVLIVVGSYRLNSSTPIVSSCSAAIAAACHTGSFWRHGGEDTGIQKVQWGVMGYYESGIGHCGFSPDPVRTLEGGQQFQ
jgi:hypothetical protein